MQKNRYLETVYSEENAPFSEYPSKLVNFLIDKARLLEKQKILELGCGRGDFINEFKKKGLKTYGIDLSDYSKNYFPELTFSKVDLTKDKLPYEDNFFDVIYSKSFIEHFYYPEKIFQEAYRVLKPGGKICKIFAATNYRQKLEQGLTFVGTTI